MFWYSQFATSDHTIIVIQKPPQDHTAFCHSRITGFEIILVVWVSENYCVIDSNKSEHGVSITSIGKLIRELCLCSLSTRAVVWLIVNVDTVLGLSIKMSIISIEQKIARTG